MRNLEKKDLDKLLSFWIAHTDQHMNDTKDWIEDIKRSISSDIAADLEMSIGLFREINQIFEAVREKNTLSTPIGSEPEISPESPITAKKSKELTFPLRMIGEIRTPYEENAPYQPQIAGEGESYLVVNPQYALGLKSLDQFRYIYVLYYIDRVTKDYSNIVSPPWTGGHEVGIFASRSPVRPNPIGLSIVQVKRVEDNVVYTTGLDVFDRTPLLDVKPYIRDLDSKKDANFGWIEDLEGYEHLILHLKGIPHDY